MQGYRMRVISQELTLLTTGLLYRYNMDDVDIGKNDKFRELCYVPYAQNPALPKIE